MADDAVVIPLKLDPGFFDELDRRFDQLAQRASQKFNTALRGGGGTSGVGGASGNSPGGSAFGNGGGSAAGSAARPDISTGLGAILGGMGEGFLNTRGSSAQSPTVLADNAIMGGANAGVGLLKTGLMGLGMTLGGPAGMAAGGLVGDLIQSQFNAFKDEAEIPRERGIGRLKAIYGQFAASGIETTEAERQQAIDFTQAIEQRRYQGEQQLERQYRETNPSILSRGASPFGT